MTDKLVTASSCVVLDLCGQETCDAQSETSD